MNNIKNSRTKSDVNITKIVKKKLTESEQRNDNTQRNNKLNRPLLNYLTSKLI